MMVVAPSASSASSISMHRTSVVFAALTGRSPVGNPYLAGIDAPTATFPQTVAWETVQEYYQK
jgi:hypothetical protein